MANTYSIQAGDTLSQIAQNQGTTIAELQKLNPQITNPNLIYAGQNLNLPAPMPTIKPELNQPIDIGKVGASVASELNILELPGTEPNLLTAKGSLASMQTAVEEMLKAQQEQQKQFAEQQKTFQTQQQSWFDKLLGKPSQQETRQAEFEKLGIKPAEYFVQRQSDIAEVSKLMEEYDKAVAAKEAELSRIENRTGASVDFIAREMTRAEKDANIRLSQMAAQIKTKTAVMQAKEQNFEQARQFADEAVQDYVFDLRLEYQQFEEFRNINQDILSGLDKKYQDTFDKAFTLALNTWKIEEDRISQVMDLVVKYPDASWPSDLSKLTLEQASRIVNQRTVKPEKPDIFGTQETGYYQQVFNPKTNQWEVKPLGIKGTGAGAEEQIIVDRLTSLKGPGGYVDINVYKSERAKSKMGPDEFDKRFASIFLSGEDREKFKIGPQEFKGTLTQEQQSIINNAKARLERAKQDYEPYDEIRQQVIDMAKNLYGFDITPYID